MNLDVQMPLLSSAQLSSVQLTQLSSVQLCSAQLSSAQLSSAQLSSAQLSSVQFSSAQLSSAQDVCMYVTNTGLSQDTVTLLIWRFIVECITCTNRLCEAAKVEANENNNIK